MPTIMQKGHAPFKYVHTKVVQYYSCIVDLRWCRSIHSCDVCPYRSQKNGSPCNSVHYGICSPVVSVPFKGRPRGAGSPTTAVAPVRKISIPIHIQSNANKDGTVVTEKKETDNRPAQDGEAGLFLRQKREELNQKRQDRLVVKEKEAATAAPSDKVTASGDATVTAAISSPSPSESAQSPLADKFGINLNAANREPTKRVEIVSINENKDIAAPNSSNLSQKSKQLADVIAKQPVSVPTATTATSTPTSVTPTLDSLASGQPTNGINRPLPQLSQNANGANIPQFYFPMGRPAETVNEVILQRVKEEFDKVEGGKVTKSQIGAIVKACGIPLYWKNSFFRYLGGEKIGHVTVQGFLAAWKKLSSTCFDAAARFVCIMAKPGCNFLEFEDFLPLVQDVVDIHPGLKFLQDAPEFHSRYVQTVIARIFYCVNRSWTGRVTAQEIRKTNLLATIELLEDEEDINQIVDYFSYEHFYVIYCKFWELDTDHDLLISKEDLSRHNDHAISSRMIDRVFSGAVTRNLVDGKLSYRDFVWFLISEEDKRHPRSVEYWFRCMDLDGNGIISMYEMEYFYEEQVQKMEMLGIETLPFQDCLCQMLDMIRPEEEGKIRLKDLKACSLTPIFFDTFFNLDKYLEHEQKDPFASIRDRDGDEPEMTDWERFAAEEYELLVAEEGATDMHQEDMNYEDDFEPEEMVEHEGVNVEAKQKNSGVTPLTKAGTLRDANSKKEDIYDFSSNDLGY